MIKSNCTVHSYKVNIQTEQKFLTQVISGMEKLENILKQNYTETQQLKIIIFKLFNCLLLLKFLSPDKIIFNDYAYISGFLNFITPVSLNLVDIPEDNLQEITDLFDQYQFSLNEFPDNSHQNIITPDVFSSLFEKQLSDNAKENSKGYSGSFYTPRKQAILMSKISIADFLSSNLDNRYFKMIYSIIFSNQIMDQDDIISRAENINIQEDIYTILNNITIADPASGTGSLLISSLYIIYDLIKLFNKDSENEDSSVKMVKGLIERSLFGMDITKGACEITVLRLRLALLHLNREASNIQNFINTEKLKTNIVNADSLTSKWKDLFPEVFNTEKAGFDIVIGNPPYVRQELISNPQDRYSDNNLADRQEYKSIITGEIYNYFPDFFSIKDSKQTQSRKIIAKSDLYIYFYFLGLSILNNKGTFCFLTSNSWLDVEFGSILQDYITTSCHLKLVLEDNTTQYFETADVNTVIVTISKTCCTPESSKRKRLTRFISLKSPVNYADIGDIICDKPDKEQIKSNQKYRVQYVQNQLMQPEKPGYPYKWGAKFLRSPQVYWTIMHNASNKLTKLNTLADIRFGIKTGANDFFYLNDEIIAKWDIDEEFIKPFLYSFREITGYKVKKSELAGKMFLCKDSKDLLKKNNRTGTLEYIKWGESQGFNNRPSVKNRLNWYTLPEQNEIHFVSNRFAGERIAYPYIEDISVCDVFFAGRFLNNKPLLSTALLNSAVSILSTEVFARKTYSIGVAYLYGSEINYLDIIKPDLFTESEATEIAEIFNKMCDRPLYKLEKEFIQRDRRELDVLVLKKLGFSATTVDDIYSAIVDMVSCRHQKVKDYP